MNTPARRALSHLYAAVQIAQNKADDFLIALRAEGNGAARSQNREILDNLAQAARRIDKLIQADDK